MIVQFTIMHKKSRQCSPMSTFHLRSSLLFELQLELLMLLLPLTISTTSKGPAKPLGMNCHLWQSLHLPKTWESRVMRGQPAEICSDDVVIVMETEVNKAAWIQASPIAPSTVVAVFPTAPDAAHGHTLNHILNWTGQTYPHNAVFFNLLLWIEHDQAASRLCVPHSMH